MAVRITIISSPASQAQHVVLSKLVNELAWESYPNGNAGHSEGDTYRVFGCSHRCYGDTTHNLLRQVVVDRKAGNPSTMGHITLDAELLTPELAEHIAFLLQPVAHANSETKTVTLLKRLLWACR
jgi:hypothetical protein